VHDAEHPPAYDLPANKTRVVYKTATSPANGTSNEIYFEDKRGAELMFMNASKDQTFFVQGARNEEVIHDGVHRVGQNHSITVTLEAIERVDQFVDQMLRVGEPAGFALHGHGTGALKAAVREHLALSRWATDARPADPDDGGDAFTVFWLRG